MVKQIVWFSDKGMLQATHLILLLLPLVLGMLAGSLPRKLCGKEELDGPAALTPPGWVFGVVWTVLYLMLGVVLLRLAGTGGHTPLDRIGLVLFSAQLVLNLSWTSVYLCVSRQAAFFVIAAIVALTLSLALWLAGRDPVSAALLGPYVAWLLAAAHLNALVVHAPTHTSSKPASDGV